MNAENTQNPTTPDIGAVGDVDDVEAHGLKEVALGIGAAAVIGGGGAGVALASTGGSAVSHGPVGHPVQQVQTDANNLIHRHAPQGPPAASPNNGVYPTTPHVIDKAKDRVPHTVPVGFSRNETVPVGDPLAAAENTVAKDVNKAKHGVKTAEDIVKHMTTPVNAPPAER